MRERAVKVRGRGLANGKYRDIDEPGVSHYAAKRAYADGGLTPADIDLAENGGGTMGFDDAICAITVLQRN